MYNKRNQKTDRQGRLLILSVIIILMIGGVVSFFVVRSNSAD